MHVKEINTFFRYKKNKNHGKGWERRFLSLKVSIRAKLLTLLIFHDFTLFFFIFTTPLYVVL